MPLLSKYSTVSCVSGTEQSPVMGESGFGRIKYAPSSKATLKSQIPSSSRSKPGSTVWSMPVNATMDLYSASSSSQG